MNYLQLSRELAKLAAISGEPSAVTNQTGEHKRIVEWIQQAWDEIQALHDDWLFLWAEKPQEALFVGQSIYDKPVDCNVIIDNSFRVIDNGNATAVSYLPFDQFRTLYPKGNTVTGKPQQYTVRPDDRIEVHPIPDKAYLYDFDYFKKGMQLLNNTDVPAMPEKHHMAIVYLALRYYAEYEEDVNVLASADIEYNKRLTLMVNDLLPDVTISWSFV